MPTDQNIIKVNINDIVPSKNQPRKIFNEESIKELALSIKNYGILNPILVRKTSSGYEIVAGERRYRAAKMLGLEAVPVIIKDLSDNEVREIALIENLQRNNLNPIEEAKAVKEIMSTNNITQQELSEKIGKTQSYISNKMRLLNLSKEAKEAILNGQISERHGRTLLKLTDEEQNQVVSQIIKNKLSVKETEELITKKSSKENIKNILNGIDLDTSDSNTFNDKEQEIKEKGEENMNNNTGVGSFFPQIDNPNQEINNNLNNETIMFNNSPINTIQESNTISFDNNTTTVPLTTLNQEPTISTIPNMTNSGIPVTAPPEPLNLEQAQINPTVSDSNILIQPEITTPIENNNLNIMDNNQPTLFNNPETIEIKTTNNIPPIDIPTGTLDKPLFTNTEQPLETIETQAHEVPDISINIPENNISADLNSVPNIEKSSVDKIKEVLNNLNDMNVSYKEFSNDIEKCIIISIKQ